MAHDLDQVIYIAGHRGMVGSALVRRLTALGYRNLLTATHAELDLLDQAAVNRFFANHPIDQVYLAAARVGGIHANNTYPADFIYQNLLIEANLIQAAHAHGVQKLLFLGSSCIYPQLAPQPMAEAALLTGTLEPTNEPYAIAKIAGIKLCESYNRQHGRDYRSVMPTNLYGPGDNYHPENSHVIPALLRRFHEAVCTGADQVTIWGRGTPRREFLHVDDMAAACVHVMALAPASYQAHTRPIPGPYPAHALPRPDNRRILGYDNGHGIPQRYLPADHRHRHPGDEGQPFRFISPERLLQDFFRDVDAWLEVES